MANWYYYNKNGEKVGPISVAALKTLTGQGLITRETVIENHTGRTAIAGEVNGLTFPEAIQPEPATPPMPSVKEELLTAPPPDDGELYGLSSPEPTVIPPAKPVVPPVAIPPDEANPFTATMNAENNPFTAEMATLESTPFVEAPVSPSSPTQEGNPFSVSPSTNPFVTATLQAGQRSTVRQNAALFPPLSPGGAVPQTAPATAEHLLVKNPTARIVVCCVLGVLCFLMAMWFGSVIAGSFQKPKNRNARPQFQSTPSYSAPTAPSPEKKHVAVHAPVNPHPPISAAFPYRGAVRNISFEVWANGKRIGYKSSQAMVEILEVNVPPGTTTLEGRVIYRYGSETTTETARGSISDINESFLTINTR